MMMMMSSGGGGGGRSCSRFPFTASQLQELEHQALVFKYMVSGMPIPPDLLYTIRRSLQDHHLHHSSKFHLIPQPPQSIGWNGFQMGFGRKIDPEPGRCRRTDGKKWRCSKEAYPDSKYCERHMHRGRNRSRKPVEILSSPPTPVPTPAAVAATPQLPNAIPINTSITNNNNNKPPTLLHQHHPSSTPSSYLTCSSAVAVSPSEAHFLTSHFQASRPPPGISLSSQESTTNFFLESPGKGACRNGSIPGGSSMSTDHPSPAWKLAPLTMGSSLYQMNHNAAAAAAYPDNGHRIQSPGDQVSRQHKNAHYYYNHNADMPSNLEMDDQQQPKKVMHHFLDEWPPKDKDSWLNSDQDKRTQLSISIPNSLHDFFMTPK